MTEQNEDTRGEIVLYQGQDGTVELDVRLERESLWLSLNQIAALFERDKSVISRHLGNVYAGRGTRPPGSCCIFCNSDGRRRKERTRSSTSTSTRSSPSAIG